MVSISMEQSDPWGVYMVAPRRRQAMSCTAAGSSAPSATRSPKSCSCCRTSFLQAAAGVHMGSRWPVQAAMPVPLPVVSRLNVSAAVEQQLAAALPAGSMICLSQAAGEASHAHSLHEKLT